MIWLLNILFFVFGIPGLALFFIGIVSADWIFLMWGTILLGLSYLMNYLIEEYE